MSRLLKLKNYLEEHRVKSPAPRSRYAMIRHHISPQRYRVLLAARALVQSIQQPARNKWGRPIGIDSDNPYFQRFLRLANEGDPAFKSDIEFASYLTEHKIDEVLRAFLRHGVYIPKSCFDAAANNRPLTADDLPVLFDRKIADINSLPIYRSVTSSGGLAVTGVDDYHGQFAYVSTLTVIWNSLKETKGRLNKLGHNLPDNVQEWLSDYSIGNYACPVTCITEEYEAEFVSISTLYDIFNMELRNFMFLKLLEKAATDDPERLLVHCANTAAKWVAFHEVAHLCDANYKNGCITSTPAACEKWAILVANAYLGSFSYHYNEHFPDSEHGHPQARRAILRFLWWKIINNRFDRRRLLPVGKEKTAREMVREIKEAIVNADIQKICKELLNNILRKRFREQKRDIDCDDVIKPSTVETIKRAQIITEADLPLIRDLCGLIR